jgi:hypothetical protein
LSIPSEEAKQTPNMPHAVSATDDAAFVHSLMAGTREYQKKQIENIGAAAIADIPERFLKAYLMK